MESINETPESKFTFQKPRLPLVWLSLAFMAGILLAGSLTLPEFAWLIAAMVVLAAVLLLRLLPRQRPGYLLERLRLPAAFPFLFILVLLAAFFTGAARYQSTLPPLDAHHIAWYNDREYELLVTGTLSAPPDQRDAYTNLRVNTGSIDTGDETLQVRGVMLARVAARR